MVHVLGAPGLAILLILLEVTQQGKKKAEWLSPSQRRRYGLSDDSWTRGTAELSRLGVVVIGKKSVGDFDFKRVRHTYTLNPARLHDVPVPTEEPTPPPS